jgi:hypothetical protein
MLRVSVSDLDLYRAYRNDEDFDLGVFLAQLRHQTARTGAMDRGVAFHTALEHATLGESSILTAEGHTFAFTCDAEIEAWPRREEKREKDYGGVIVSARCDRIMGKVIVDDKTTEKFDSEAMERYMDKYQFRYYLDMWEADEFRWHIWEVRKLSQSDYKSMTNLENSTIAYEVYAHHLLKQYRYPKMEEDCRDLALEFADFAATIGYKREESHENRTS